MQCFRAGLAVWQPRLATFEIYPLPLQPEHFTKPSPCEYQQLDRSGVVGRAVIASEYIAKPRQFFSRQEPLAPPLAILLDMMAGVGAIRPPADALREIE